MKEKKFEFDVALSFAGENRNYVEKVAQSLKDRGVRVFYDMFEEMSLWGKNLYDYLSDIYKNKAKYTVIFISEFYNKKLWTNHERESMQARAFQESNEYILPARFDDTEIPGILRTIGYISLNSKTPEEFASLIEGKVKFDGDSSGVVVSTLSKVKTLVKPKPYIFIVKVVNAKGISVENAKIVLIANNSTYLETITDDSGSGHFVMKTTQMYTAIITHPKYCATVLRKVNPKEDIEVVLNTHEASGSSILYKWGMIPGLLGRIEPVMKRNKQMSLYADNIAIDGGKHQPVIFELNKSISLEDKEGTIMEVTFIFLKGRIAVLEYRKPTILTY